jgi:hypothetical protein
VREKQWCLLHNFFVLFFVTTFIYYYYFFFDINELSKKINLDGLKLHNVGGVTQNRST